MMDCASRLRDNKDVPIGGTGIAHALPVAHFLTEHKQRRMRCSTSLNVYMDENLSQPAVPPNQILLAYWLKG